MFLFFLLMLFFEIVVNSVVCSSLKGKMNHLFPKWKIKEDK